MSQQKNDFQIKEQEGGVVMFDYKERQENQLIQNLKNQVKLEKREQYKQNYNQKLILDRILFFGSSGNFLCLGLERGFQLYDFGMFFQQNLQYSDKQDKCLVFRSQNQKKEFRKKYFKKMMKSIKLADWTVFNLSVGQDYKIALQFMQRKDEIYIWDQKSLCLFQSVQFNQEIKKFAYPKQNILVVLSVQFRLIIYNLEQNKVLLLRERISDFSISSQNIDQEQIYMMAYTSLEDEVSFCQKLFCYNFVLASEFEIDFAQNKDLKQLDYSFYSVSQQFNKFQAIQVSQDGSLVAVVSEFGQRIAILSTQNQGELVALLKRGNSSKIITDIQFSKDNFICAVVSYDKTDQNTSETLHVFDITNTNNTNGNKQQEINSKYQYDFNLWKDSAKKINFYYQSSLYNLLGPKIIFNEQSSCFNGEFKIALVSETNFFFVVQGNVFQDPKEFPKKINLNDNVNYQTWMHQEQDMEIIP
ncbi:WD40-repeat-containing domain [Pseudocohnilembus persalinus]|uniref:WD40-repeat-containing domain n=1 Tax=Pseudocohnilembus persalinus TaxID=266149 RepID=A0A0V0QUX2_PSEPJ|nr:WD40-repeat-containing domain [Pseudocohnilembus persalinus]|eukprot:KRX06211.1 WD40-repeat-containing domain [Pseudocohnilembus persalinus]